jgi:general nucleoside transport system permease protein
MSLALGITVGLTGSAVFLLAIGIPQSALLREFIIYPFAPYGGLDRTVVRAIPLSLMGLAVAAGLRIRFWNIGIEGQFWAGAMASTAIAIFDLGPSETRLVLIGVAAAVAGGFWSYMPAEAKVRLGASELISTLLLNYIAFLLVQHLLFGAWRDNTSRFPVSASFDAGERLLPFGFGRVHTGVFVVIAAAVFYWWLIKVSRFGKFIEATAANPIAAGLIGLPVDRMTVMVGVLSGALAGLAGFVVVAGQEFRLTQFIGQNYIFAAVLVAFLGRMSALGCLLAAIGIGGIYTAADTLKAFYQLPLAMVVTVQSILFLAIALSTFIPQYQLLVIWPQRDEHRA